jgi:TetR/AcrR family transcriptional regulator
LAKRGKNIDVSTEQRIVYAAEKIFIRDGYDGGRMQAIADEAEINKAMLHYYFKSKDDLFKKILMDKLALIFPNLTSQIDKPNINYLDALKIFVMEYLKIMTENPYLPLFVVNSMHKHKGPKSLMGKKPIEIGVKMAELYEVDCKKGILLKLDYKQLHVSIMGMIMFPFIAKPMVSIMAEQIGGNFDEMIDNRAVFIVDAVKQILKK